MTTPLIEQRVKEIISKRFNIGLERIQPETRLAEDLGVDSFAAVELMFELEESFGLKIEDSEIENIRSVRDVVTYISAWLEKAPAA